MKRKTRVRSRVKGTSERPRLNVFRSLKHIYAQAIEDSAGRTLVSVSSLSPELKGSVKHPGNIEAAKGGGTHCKSALKRDSKGHFDRNGYLYHGRVKALASRTSGWFDLLESLKSPLLITQTFKRITRFS
jgi:large subunit ribosomal protein L18